ncbi:MAG: PH domain-containing protein [Acidimicrobiales bacterium]|nr:PH domain-containing protein [Acidimicrobiales bacterium]
MAGARVDLTPGEHVLVDLRPHWAFLSGPLAVAALVVAVGVTLDVAFPHTSVALHWLEGIVVAVPCLWLAVRVVRWRTTHLVLTTARLVETWGTTRPSYWEAPFERISSVSVVQSLPRRLVGTGRLRITLWEDNRSHWIDDVHKPTVLRRVIARRLGPDPTGGSGGAR